MQYNQETSDTLIVNVTDLKYPVTEDTIRAVFDSVASVAQVRMLPQKDSNTVSAVAQFHDARGAEAARRERNGRCIYSECNRMEISFGNKHQVQQPQQQQMFNQPQGQGQPTNFQQQPQQQPMPQLGGQQFQQQQPIVMQNFQQPPQMNNQYQPNQQQFSAQQNPQQFQPNRGGFQQNQMMGGPMGGRGYGRGRGGQQFQPQYDQQQQYGGRGTGFRGRGFHQDQGQGFNPRGRGMGYNGRGRGGFNDNAYGGQTEFRDDQVNPFVSIAMLAEDIPLFDLYKLLEVWGNVVYIKRNFKKPEVITARFSDYADAVNCSNNLKRPPIGNGECEISGKIFGHFSEKSGFSEPNDEGDPSSIEVKAFNFSNCKHRMGAHRIKTGITDTLKVFNVPAETGVEAVQGSLQFLGVTPQSIMYDNNVYIVTFDDARTAVKALIAGHNQVCGEEKSVLVFCPSTKVASVPTQPAVEESAMTASSSDPSAMFA